MSEYREVLIPVLGTADEDELVPVAYIAEYPRNAKGFCAYCEGDPLGERSVPESRIAQFWKRNRGWADTCPVCRGRPT